jgi:hypothetical protein
LAKPASSERTEAHRCIDKDVVNAPRALSIKRQRNEVRVAMPAMQGLSIGVLPSEFRASTELLLIADPAQQRPPEEGHGRERSLHERKDIALLVGRERKQGRVFTVGDRATRPPERGNVRQRIGWSPIDEFARAWRKVPALGLKRFRVDVQRSDEIIGRGWRTLTPGIVSCT